jgi:hypothetical protein
MSRNSCSLAQDRTIVEETPVNVGTERNLTLPLSSRLMASIRSCNVLSQVSCLAKTTNRPSNKRKTSLDCRHFQFVKSKNVSAPKAKEKSVSRSTSRSICSKSAVPTDSSSSSSPVLQATRRLVPLMSCRFYEFVSLTFTVSTLTTPWTFAQSLVVHLL